MDDKHFVTLIRLGYLRSYLDWGVGGGGGGG